MSKTLAPGLRLGWLVSPPGLLAELRTAKRDDDFGTSALEQHVLARLMDTGEYDRHVRRLRKHYHRRRDSIVDGIGRVMPDAVAEGYAAGLHLLLRLPKNVDEDAFVSAAEGPGSRGARDVTDVRHQSSPTQSRHRLRTYVACDAGGGSAPTCSRRRRSE